MKVQYVVTEIHCLFIYVPCSLLQLYYVFNYLLRNYVSSYVLCSVLKIIMISENNCFSKSVRVHCFKCMFAEILFLFVSWSRFVVTYMQHIR